MLNICQGNRKYFLILFSLKVFVCVLTIIGTYYFNTSTWNKKVNHACRSEVTNSLGYLHATSFQYYCWKMVCSMTNKGKCFSPMLQGLSLTS